MKKKRPPYLIVAVGKKNAGKTYQTIKEIREALLGDARADVRPRRALILDVNDEFKQFKTLPLAKVKEFSSNPLIEVRRITIFKNNGKKMTLKEIADALYYILDNYQNGILLVEDPTKYLGDSLPQDVIGALCTQRHEGVDVILHFQLLGKSGHPKIMGNINKMRFHKVTDSSVHHKKKFEDYLPMISIAQNIVNLEHKKGVAKSKFAKMTEEGLRIFFYVWIDFDNDKIIGEFDRTMFQEAVHEYINQNERTTIGFYLKKRDINGKYLYNYSTAYRQVQKDFVEDYYGNP